MLMADTTLLPPPHVPTAHALALTWYPCPQAPPRRTFFAMTTLVAIATAQSRRFFATELAPSMAHHDQKSCLLRQRPQLLNPDGPHDHPTMHPPYFEHAGSEFGAWECPETLIQCDIRICSTGPQSMPTCEETKRRRNQPTTTQDSAISASPYLVYQARA